ncbi:MAG: transposase [Methylovulum sp.]|nr:transposase [Methylovulum sp.]
MLKQGLHSPAHLFIDNTTYFITGSIYQKRPLLASEIIKHHLITTIKDCFNERQWLLNDWVILDNHYHLLAMSHKGEDMTKIFRKIHGKSTRFIQTQCVCELPVWWNYWDYCPRNEREYLIRLNYLFNNPIKHGYVQNLHDYPFSSFQVFINILNNKGVNYWQSNLKIMLITKK